jgi:type II secretory pathway component GspD/PulD (secretin)
VATTVIVPNGGTLLVGGLAEAEENRGVASVPFLSDLPAVGHLLRGWDRSEGRRTLVILVTAQIVPDVFER